MRLPLSRPLIPTERRLGRGRPCRLLGPFLFGSTLVLAACGSSGAPPATTTTVAPSTTAPSTTAPTATGAAALSTSPPPWPLPSNATPYIAEAGLSAAPNETLAVHYHAHLDIIVNGQPVAVPAGLGFVVRNGQAVGVTALHTHDGTGVIHVESPTDAKYTLGQLFTEWGVKLDGTHLGGLVAGNGHELRVYVDGARSTTSADQAVLRPHEEIVLWYGPAAAQPQLPTSYSFPAGE